MHATGQPHSLRSHYFSHYFSSPVFAAPSPRCLFESRDRNAACTSGRGRDHGLARAESVVKRTAVGRLAIVFVLFLLTKAPHSDSVA